MSLKKKFKVELWHMEVISSREKVKNAFVFNGITGGRDRIVV